MIQKEQFEDWLENPTTEIFLKYLKDSADGEVNILKDGIIGGSILSDTEQMRVATIHQTLMDISEIDAGEINDFYEEEE